MIGVDKRSPLEKGPAGKQLPGFKRFDEKLQVLAEPAATRLLPGSPRFSLRRLPN
jgi:hypothetical protein